MSIPVTLILLIAVLLAFALSAVLLPIRERRERLRILEEVLRDERVDDATRQELLQSLARERQDPADRRRPARRFSIGRISFGLGWLTMVAGAGCTTVGDRDATEAGLFMLVLGFGMLTLPMALREYDRRGGTARSEEPGSLP